MISGAEVGRSPGAAQEVLSLSVCVFAQKMKGEIGKSWQSGKGLAMLLVPALEARWRKRAEMERKLRDGPAKISSGGVCDFRLGQAWRHLGEGVNPVSRKGETGRGRKKMEGMCEGKQDWLATERNVGVLAGFKAKKGRVGNR